MSATDAEKLLELVTSDYPATEFPILFDQYSRWRMQRPLVGVRIVDATPSMRNTAAKYVPLIAGGAQVTVGISPEVPTDQAATKRLEALGIVSAPVSELSDADVVLDCAGVCANVASSYGYAELTRTGVHRYRGKHAPVIAVDSSQVKEIENEFGTGDGFVRALKQLGHADMRGESVVVFGAGKVGRGICRAVLARGGTVIAVDELQVAQRIEGISAVDRNDTEEVISAIAGAWCVVSATGVREALSPWTEALMDSDALIANMGVEDEFGAGVPAGRVLNAKLPLNFILAEPTRLRFIDPTFALSNQCAVELVAGRAEVGVHGPQLSVEQPVLDLWQRSRPHE